METKAVTKESGDERKKDDGKMPWSLLPADALESVVEVYAIGAKKYSPNGWAETPIEFSRVFSAMMRHAWKWWRGEEYDPVDGQHHLASVAWCALTLLAYTLRNTSTDDRPKRKDLGGLS